MQQVAIKYFNYMENSNNSFDKLAAGYLKEVRVMLNVQHEHLVTFYGFCSSKCCIVTELMPKGDLKSYLSRNKNNINLPERMCMAFQVECI